MGAAFLAMLRKMAKWVEAHPIWGLVAALLALLGAQGLRLRYIEARAKKIAQEALRLKTEAKVAGRSERSESLENGLKRADAEAEIAAETAKDHAEEAAKAVEQRKKIAGKYRRNPLK